MRVCKSQNLAKCMVDLPKNKALVKKGLQRRELLIDILTKTENGIASIVLQNRYAKNLGVVEDLSE